MMNRDKLMLYLEQQFASPQPSERWSMYRLVNPLVDEACEQTGWEPYYEFSQPSSIGTSQAVDIALLENGIPRILIEAKKLRRKVTPDLVLKYLMDDVFGCVTNGNNWIFVMGQRHAHCELYNSENDTVNPDSLDYIVRFLQRHNLREELDWSEGNIEYSHRVNPLSFGVAGAKRKSLPKSNHTSSVGALRKMEETDIRSNVVSGVDPF